MSKIDKYINTSNNSSQISLIYFILVILASSGIKQHQKPITWVIHWIPIIPRGSFQVACEKIGGSFRVGDHFGSCTVPLYINQFFSNDYRFTWGFNQNRIHSDLIQNCGSKMADGSSSIFNNKLRYVIALLLFNNYSTSAVGYELVIIISYPTSASGINCFIKNAHKISMNRPNFILLEQTGKDKGLPLFTYHTSIKTVNARTDWTFKKIKTWPHLKLTGILGFYRAGQLKNSKIMRTKRILKCSRWKYCEFGCLVQLQK